VRFWFLVTSATVVVAILLDTIWTTLRNQSTEEEEARALLDAVWRERDRQERRRLELDAVTTLTERGRR